MWIDIIALVSVFLFALLGYSRGLFSQAWSVASLVGSYWGATPALELVRAQIQSGADDSLLGEWILRLVVGLALYILLLMVGFGVEKLVVERFQLISVGNRMLGAVLGALKGTGGVLIALWLLLFFAGATLRSDGDLAAQLNGSRVAAWVGPYNPCNLLLLARVRPYLPKEFTGSAQPPVKPPKTIASNETFKALVADQALGVALRERALWQIMQNPTFHRFVEDRSLLDALEKVQ